MMRRKHITISQAVKAYGINRSTLTSWVTKQKVRSEKRTVGSKKVHFIEVASLKAHVKESGLEKPSKTLEDSSTSAEGQLSLRETSPKPEARKKRPQHRRKTPYQHAINSIRSLSTHDLLKVAQWIPKRVERKIEVAIEPDIQPDGKADKTEEITKDIENGK